MKKATFPCDLEHTLQKVSLPYAFHGRGLLPTCEAGVEVTAKFCLSCGHDLTAQGPITATGHDLKAMLRMSATKADILKAIESIWTKRKDQYSAERSSFPEPQEKVEMSFIGG